MRTATLVHVETVVEFYKSGRLYFPTQKEKLFWALNGTPPEVKRLEQTFETEIDELVGFTKREIQAKCDENFKKGVYNFLPSMGFNENLELRF